VHLLAKRKSFELIKKHSKTTIKIVISIYNMANAEGFEVEATLATLD
jgi:hypothetical protein